MAFHGVNIITINYFVYIFLVYKIHINLKISMWSVSEIIATIVVLLIVGFLIRMWWIYRHLYVISKPSHGKLLTDMSATYLVLHGTCVGDQCHDKLKALHGKNAEINTHQYGLLTGKVSMMTVIKKEGPQVAVAVALDPHSVTVAKKGGDYKVSASDEVVVYM